MNLETLKNMKTCDLINFLSEALKNEEQSLANIYAYELTTRIYIPNEEVSFDEMLNNFGYRENKGKTYVLSRKK